MPREPRTVLGHPARGICLEVAYYIGERFAGGHGHQDVQVVCRAAERQNFDMEVLCDPEHVGKEAFLDVIGDRICPLFRAEDAMDEICEGCVGQALSPALTRWANK